MLAAVMVLPAASAFAQVGTPPDLESGGARPLAKDEVEKLLFGAKVSIGHPSGAERRWTHGPRGSFIASMQPTPNGTKSRAIHGKGTAKVDESGAYCVHIEWPRSVESWCRRVYTLDGAYYAVSIGREQRDVNTLHVVQPNPGRLNALGRLWYLARSPGR